MTMPDQIKDLLDEIETLDYHATTGPWDAEPGCDTQSGWFDGTVRNRADGDSVTGEVSDADGSLIALSRTALPAMAKVLRAVMEMHKTRAHDEDPTTTFCNFCGPVAPCETTRAITDAMEG